MNSVAGTILNRVRALRKARGLTQEHLGTLLGVSRQTINAIEKGRYEPSLRLAFDIARVFAAGIEDVFRPAHAGAEVLDWGSLLIKLPTRLAAGPVHLRTHCASDLTAFQAFVMDPESTRFMAFTPEQRTPEGAAAMMNAVIASYASATPVLSLTIADPLTDAYLGAVGGAECGSDALELFVTLIPAARGKGYALAAMRALIAYLFDTCAADELRADTVAENAASVALFERLGFRKRGRVERSGVDGVFAHREMQGVRYVMTRADYRKHRASGGATELDRK